MSPPSLEGDGKVVWITGAASGMGLAMAEVFAGAGWRVALGDVDGEACQRETARLAEELEMPAGHLLPLELDVTREEQVRAARDTLLEHFGELHGVINNAGISGPEGPLEALATEDLRRVLEVNLVGPFLVTREALPALRGSGGGVVIHIGSMVAARGAPAYPAYSAAKAGLEALTRSLARSLGRSQIRVLCIAPGSTTGTGFLEAGLGRPLTTDETRRMTLGLMSKIPLGRAARPRDVAHLALFLASPLAGHLHGTVITLDGGESLGS